MAAGLSEAQAEDALSKLDDDLDEDLKVQVGCVNSPKNVTLTGDAGQLEVERASLEDDKVFNRMLPVDVAYHSKYMISIANDYKERLGTIEAGRKDEGGHAIMISTVTGTKIDLEEVQKPEYWVRNMTSPVLFSKAISTLCKDYTKPQRKQLGAKAKRPHVSDIVEVGPHSTLQMPVQEVLKETGKGDEVQYIKTMVRNSPAAKCIAETAGLLYCRGAPVGLLAVHAL